MSGVSAFIGSLSRTAEAAYYGTRFLTRSSALSLRQRREDSGSTNGSGAATVMASLSCRYRQSGCSALDRVWHRRSEGMHDTFLQHVCNDDAN